MRKRKAARSKREDIYIYIYVRIVVLDEIAPPTTTKTRAEINHVDIAGLARPPCHVSASTALQGPRGTRWREKMGSYRSLDPKKRDKKQNKTKKIAEEILFITSPNETGPMIVGVDGKEMMLPSFRHATAPSSSISPPSSSFTGGKYRLATSSYLDPTVNNQFWWRGSIRLFAVSST